MTPDEPDELAAALFEDFVALCGKRGVEPSLAHAAAVMFIAAIGAQAAVDVETLVRGTSDALREVYPFAVERLAARRH